MTVLCADHPAAFRIVVKLNLSLPAAEQLAARVVCDSQWRGLFLKFTRSGEGCSFNPLVVARVVPLIRPAKEERQTGIQFVNRYELLHAPQCRSLF